MYYERLRHYNPILSLKTPAGARGGYCVSCNMGYRVIKTIEVIVV